MTRIHRPTVRSGAALATAALIAGGGAALALAGPATAAALPSCTGAQLAVSHTAANGATGHGSMALEFRNRSDRRCTLHGYPGFDLINRHGRVVEHAERTYEGFAGGSRNHTVPTVTLRPGHYASALVEWQDITGGGRTCRTAKSYAFTPPNTAKTVHARGPVPVCALEVHPTVYGRSGDHG